MWKEQTINLGELKTNVEVPFSFLYQGDSPIINIQAGCSCTDTILDGNVLRGTLKSGSFPTHALISNLEKVTLIKSIDVRTTDNRSYEVQLLFDLLNPNLHK